MYTMNKLFLAVFCLLSIPLQAQFYFQAAPAGSLPSGAIGGNTMDVQSADFNGDSLLDIVLAKEFQRNRILFNNGSGGFTDATTGRLANVSNDSEDIAIADFDRNGWPDIVFASEDNAVHEMYLNIDGSNFVDISANLPNFVSNAVVALDVNLDSFPDLIFGNAGQDRILMNYGPGQFTDETTLRLPVDDNVTQDLLLVDVDKDGDMDIAVGNEDGNRLLINNNGVFTDETLTRFPQGVNMETRKISKADVDGNGYDDLFFSNMASQAGIDVRDRLYLSDNTGHFTDVTDTHLPAEQLATFDAVFTDLNNDDYPDLIVGYLINLQPGVFINDGNGVFADQSLAYLPTTAKGSNIALYVADFNNDGKTDLYQGRFQQNDRLFLGADSTSNIIDILKEQSNIVISPNPSKGIIEVGFLIDEKGDYQVHIMNQLGQTVYSDTLIGIENKHTIYANSLINGIYTLVISDGFYVEMKKISIQK
jgi:hypothetical protein